MKIGYARVSTSDQNLHRQTDALQSAGCERIFTDKVSGSKSARPGLDEMLSMLRPGDTVVIASISRLARNIKHLFQLAEDFEKKGIGLKILNVDIDTSTPAGKYLFRNWALLAEFQLDIIRDNTRKGLAAAKARGRQGGRPKGLSQEAEETAEMCEILWKNDWSATKIAEKQKISRTSVYKYLWHRGIKV